MSSDATRGDVAIRVRDISKHFLLFDRPQDRLKQSIVPRLQRLAGRPPRRYYREFAALGGVSFDVRRGETVGIVGRNGSGKSTLLQIICGTLRPNAGSVEVNGRIAALLELGAGFNPAFTGRENVYLNGAILGLSRAEIDERFDAIAGFADIGAFIDQPVKTYSSGMYVRLAFATAINVDPDILVVDEALAVGDEAFQRKCFARLEQIQERGATILFVSHSAQLVVQLCSRALLVDRGELLLDSAPKLVIGQYQRLLHSTPEKVEQVRAALRELAADTSARPSHGKDDLQVLAGERAVLHGSANDTPPAPPEALNEPLFLSQLKPSSTIDYGTGEAVIRGARILSSSGRAINVLSPGQSYVYEYFADFLTTGGPVSFGMLIKTVSGLELGGISTDHCGLNIPFVEAGCTIRVRMRFDCLLAPGTYFMNAGTGAKVDGEWKTFHRVVDALMFRVSGGGPPRHSGLIDFGIVPQIERVDPADV